MIARIKWLACLAAACSIAAVANAVDTVSPDAVRQNLFSACLLNENDGWAIGELGRAFHTADGGRTFVKSETNTHRGLLSVACLPDGTVYVVGQAGLAMRSKDRGATWETLKTGAEKNLISVKFPTPDLGIAVGDFGTIIRTEDGGTTWTKIKLPDDVPLPEEAAEVVDPGDILLYDVAFPTPDRGWIVGEFGTIFTTTDGGKTWVAQKSPVESTLFGVAFTDVDHGWAVGIDSTMARTADGGATWERVKVPTRSGFPLAIYDVAVAGNYGWAIGDSGFLLHSSDGGASWTLTDLPIALAGNWFRGVSLTDGGTGLIVGANGLMLMTTGDQYRQLNKKS